MIRKAILWFALLNAATALAAAQSFLLGVNRSTSIPTGPLNGVANMNAAADAKGNVYVLENGFTGTCQPVGSPPVFCAPVAASFLVKLTAAGTVAYQAALPFLVTAMTVDPAGNTYLAAANSLEKLSTDGQTVLYNEVLGGQGLLIDAIALDSAGRVYLTGQVTAGDLQATPGAFQQTAQSADDPNGFVMCLNTAGAIEYATYLGKSVDWPNGIAVDATGSAFLIWSTASTAFPVTPGAYMTSGASELARLSPDGSALLYSTFVGPQYRTFFGMQSATASLVAVDSADRAVVAMSGGYGWGLLVTGFNPKGTGVTFSQYLPGLSFGGLAIDASGDIYAFDSLLPANANYPVKNSLSDCTASATDALTVLDSSGAIVQSTYVSGVASPLGILLAPGGVVDLFASATTQGFVMTQLAPNPQAQTEQLACAGNAASYNNTAISPGELVSLFGNGLGPVAGMGAQVDAENSFPTSLAATRVTFNGIPAPLLYVQDNQINAIAPWSLQPGAPVNICVVHDGTPTNCLGMSVADSNPGIFMASAYDAVAMNQDGTPNSASNPAPLDSVVSIYATGLGALDPIPPDGSILGFPLPVEALPISMCTFNQYMGCTPNHLQYAGPAPFQVAGVSQINITVDASMGGQYASQITVGSGDQTGESNPFYIYVKQ